MTNSKPSTRRPSRRLSSTRAAITGPLTEGEDNVLSSSPVEENSPLDGEMDMDNPDPRIVQRVGRHLVNEESGFDSLQLQGGDITREIYNWQREHRTDEGEIKRGRSRSFDVQGGVHPQVGQARDMLVPGGFRRDFVATHQDAESIVSAYGSIAPSNLSNEPHVFTRNFIEYLSLYGHFAGEDLEEESEGSDDEEPLLQTRQQQRQSQQAKGQASTTETVMLLLKSFVGTGVLFLPKAFYNGGLLFSTCVMMAVSLVSYWCFMLLIAAKEHTKVGSFGDIGGELFGNRVRLLILGCIVVSQIGFASAYIVFVAENLRAFLSNVVAGDIHALAGMPTLILMQLVVFLPLSMIRDIAKLGFTALIADAFILAGLIYLYSWSGVSLLSNGVADVQLFNSSGWTLFIGTAVFTYEGIGLIIPIQESMRNPKRFGPVLGGVMIGITVVFVSVGALLYMATGSKVETVILLNLPKGGLTNTVQLLYSVAILLSTPLQLFPAIRILENALFVRSGKFSRKVKWQKNVFRFFLVFATGCVAYAGSDDLDKFVALIGSVACVPLVYIFPPLLHMKTVAYQSVPFYLDIGLAVFGLGVMLYTSATTAMAWGS